MSNLLPGVVELTQSWAAIPSVTGNEEELLRRVEADLRAQQWPLRRITVDDTRYNILAGPAAGAVLFTTHLDTVPPFFAPRVEGDRLTGRGVADAKGAAAAMFLAGALLRQQNVDSSLLYVVGEEGTSDGAKAAVSAGLRFDFVVNGEPTDNVFASWQKGTLRVEVATKGLACHSGYPDHGESAVHRLIEILGSLLVRDWQSSPVLGRETVNVGRISGGLTDNVMAPEASARLMFRTVGPWRETLRELETVIAGSATLTSEGGCDPVQIHCPSGYRKKPVAFGSDLPYLKEIGTPVMLGPGSILEAHTESETVTTGELEEAVALYVEIGTLLVGGAR